ncbi:MAG: hypothetical protein LW832_09430, partial [Parachlamydia sp.]|nr:hypothetical protein [Parachlamydia sp.]
EDEARNQFEIEKNRQKKEKIQSLRSAVQNLLQSAESYSLEQLIGERDTLLNQIQEASLNKGEKLEIERQLKPLKDVITEKNEKALMDLSEDDKQALQQLKDILEQRRERRQEIKEQLEVLRKKAGSSGLDFEKAMQTNAQISEEKERLEKANLGIAEIEDKINALQSKLKNR